MVAGIEPVPPDQPLHNRRLATRNMNFLATYATPNINVNH